MDAEGPGKNKSFTSKGKKEVIQKDVNNKKKTAIKLTPDDGDTPVYFVVVNDTTLRLVNDSLQEAVSDLNYDIIQVNSPSILIRKNGTAGITEFSGSGCCFFNEGAFQTREQKAISKS